MAGELERVRRSNEAIAVAETKLIGSVMAARKKGYSWAQIAEAMDMTRQGVSQRFRKLVEA